MLEEQPKRNVNKLAEDLLVKYKGVLPRKNDDPDVEEFFRQATFLARSYITPRIRDEHEREDIIQGAFMRMIVDFKNFNPDVNTGGGDFSTWFIFNCKTEVSKHFARKNSKKRGGDVFTTNFSGFDGGNGSDDRLFAASIRDQNSDDPSFIREGLTPEQTLESAKDRIRAIFSSDTMLDQCARARYIDGLRPVEIAEKLNKEVTYVTTQLGRAKNKLHDKHQSAILKIRDELSSPESDVWDR